MPAVSAMTMSNPAALTASITSGKLSGISELDRRVAKDRIKTRGLLMAFIRILSPKRAPPVFLRVGSQLMTATVVSCCPFKILNISSSVREDFPDPPVPVIPSTGTFRPASLWDTLFLSASRSPLPSLFICSKRVISLATCRLLSGLMASTSISVL